PREAYTYGDTGLGLVTYNDLLRLPRRRVQDVLVIEREQCAGIDEKAALEAKFIGRGAQRNEKFRRGHIIDVPAKAVIGLLRHTIDDALVARADTARLKAADGVEEAVIEAHILAKAEDITALARKLEDPALAQGEIAVVVGDAAEVTHVAAKTGDILRQHETLAARRIEAVVH